MVRRAEVSPSLVLRQTGVPAVEDLAPVMPPDEVRRRGPVAIFECFQRIPCDPCYWACKRGAVKPFRDINDTPEVDWERCNGCGLCVAACPGLAIFVVQEEYGEGTSLIKLPYEFLPLPEAGQVVDALDREGNRVGKARVVRVQRPREKVGTPVIWVEVERNLAHVVRNIAVAGGIAMSERDVRWLPGEYAGASGCDGEVVICRCEDVTLSEIRRVIGEGARSLDEIKRLTRAGMGLCQGRTCRHLILQEVSRLTGVPVEQLAVPTFRPPTRPVKLGVIARAAGQGGARVAPVPAREAADRGSAHAAGGGDRG